MKTLRITVNGKTYDVEVEVLGQDPVAAPPAPARPVVTAASHAAPAPAPAPRPAPAAASSGSGNVLSPLSAVVVSIDVQPGASVKEGEKIITLEAMKMNTVVSAPASGVIANIHVKPGDAVEEGSLLATLR